MNRFERIVRLTRIISTSTVFVFPTIAVAQPGPPQIFTLRVDATSLVNGPGIAEDWSDSFKYLQDALAVATADGDVQNNHYVIRVAKGTYKPDQAEVAPMPTNPRDATFSVTRNNLTVRGGYAGLGAPEPNANDTIIYPSILSGDLDADDIPVDLQTGELIFQNYAENSYNVLTTTGVNQSVIIEGFTITGGNDDEVEPDLNDEFGLLRASMGGGMVNFDHANPIVRRCTFIHNSCHDSGGGMANLDHSNPVIILCDFIENRAVRLSGGGMECRQESVPVFLTCRFSGNTAPHVGGGLRIRDAYLSQTPFQIVNCLFQDNYAQDAGGGIRIGFNAYAKISNCTIVNNVAGADTQNVLQGGGGI